MNKSEIRKKNKILSGEKFFNGVLHQIPLYPLQIIFSVVDFRHPREGLA
jgi:hypothetical protein